MTKFILVFALALFFGSGSFAQISSVYATPAGAINGYDPVAYFTKGKPVKGDKKFTYTWQNTPWYFSSKENLDAFSADPEKYAPQYGGYCAYGCSEGYKAPTEPDAWSIVDKKLYLNYNTKVKETWSKDVSGKIAQADKKWRVIKDKK